MINLSLVAQSDWENRHYISLLIHIEINPIVRTQMTLVSGIHLFGWVVIRRLLARHQFCMLYRGMKGTNKCVLGRCHRERFFSECRPKVRSLHVLLILRMFFSKVLYFSTHVRLSKSSRVYQRQTYYRSSSLILIVTMEVFVLFTEISII